MKKAIILILLSIVLITASCGADPDDGAIVYGDGITVRDAGNRGRRKKK